MFCEKKISGPPGLEPVLKPTATAALTNTIRSQNLAQYVPEGILIERNCSLPIPSTDLEDGRDAGVVLPARVGPRGHQRADRLRPAAVRGRVHRRGAGPVGRVRVGAAGQQHLGHGRVAREAGQVQRGVPLEKEKERTLR